MPRRFSRSVLFLSLALAAAGASLPASAKISTPPPVAGTADQPLGEAEYGAMLQRALGFAQSGDCAGLVGLLDPLLPRVTGRQRVFVQLLRVPCLDAIGRSAEVKPIYEELNALDPANGMVRNIGVVVAAVDGDYVKAAERLAQLAEQNPDQVGDVNGDLGRGIIQELTQRDAIELRDRLYVALARADWQPADRADMRDSIAQGAIEALLKRGDVDGARELLGRVTMPELLISMATERHYQPLWPAIEARLGTHGGVAVDRFALSRLEAYSTTPNSERARRDAVRAFILLGRYAEAAEMAAPVSVTEGMSEDAVNIARYHAQVLAAQGNRRGGVALLRPFTGLDFAKTPDAVSGLVGLAEMLDEDGQAEEALSVARTTLARGQNALSPWGTAWLKRTEICALGALGRAAEASRLADALASKASENEAATIEALLCIGRNDEAARIAVATFATSEGASRLTDQFQPDGAIWAPAASRLRALWATFLRRSDVRRAFDRSARILPENLWPTRDARPVPRRAPEENAPPTT